MVRALLALYLTVLFGPLALAILAWALRDGLKAFAKGEGEAGRRDGSEEGLHQTVEEVRATGSS